jgi:membrane-associated phospholipid phosphatase
LFAGRPRPDFFEYNISNPIDARLSFPSGHSSYSFAALGHTALYLVRIRGSGEIWRTGLRIIPLFVAGVVAVSRTRDCSCLFCVVVWSRRLIVFRRSS